MTWVGYNTKIPVAVSKLQLETVLLVYCYVARPKLLRLRNESYPDMSRDEWPLPAAEGRKLQQWYGMPLEALRCFPAFGEEVIAVHKEMVCVFSYL